MKIKYIGTKKTINFKPDKLYEARRSPRESEKAWVGVIDESGEEYGYPLNLFEIVEDKDYDSIGIQQVAKGYVIDIPIPDIKEFKV